MTVLINKVNTSLLYFKVNKYNNYKGVFNDYSHAPRPINSLALITEGGGIFQTRDYSFELKPGDMVFVPHNCLYQSLWNTPFSEFITIHFNFEHNDFLFNSTNYLLQKISVTDFDYYKKEFTYLNENHEKNNSNAYMVMSKFFNICHNIFPILKYKEEKTYSKNITESISYINENYAIDFDVKDLAKKVFLSESRFYNLFKKETGYTPVDYKNLIRIKNAITLLGTGKYKIEEITSMLGYKSSIYFRKVFKQFTTKSPKEFKKSFYNL